ncbi:MAG: hypothetical protein HC896_10045 [Bacteroidales bacterium]|nr:hypothetical protein [Bacteroidales bacterium]
MARFFTDRIKSKGQAPGSLIFIGDQKMERPVVQLMQYDAETLVEKELQSFQQAFDCLAPSIVNWIKHFT